MANKVCSKYGIKKSILEFYFRKDSNKFRNQCKKCWNYRNLRLIKAGENLKKNNKLNFKLIKERNILDLLPKESNYA